MPVPTSEQAVSEEIPHFPPLTQQNILHYSFSTWYNTFRDVTFKSKIIPLSQEFLKYLHADSVYLPENYTSPYASASLTEFGDEETNWDEEASDDSSENNTPSFPELEAQIWDAIREFDGAVFPKLNWSSPRDAAWITTTQSLRCVSPSDIFLLLKSSDFIVHDLDCPFEHAVADNGSPLEPSATSWQNYDLVLRKWHDLQPSMEFRCFVREGELVATCQRDMNFYEFLEAMRDEIEEKIEDFFELYIRERFPASNYVFDIYIPRHRHKVWLIDFNPFSPTTDSLLFEWSEILQASVTSEFNLRLISSPEESNARSRSGPQFSANMYPREVVEMSNQETIAEFAERFSREIGLARIQDRDGENEEE